METIKRWFDVGADPCVCPVNAPRYASRAHTRTRPYRLDLKPSILMNTVPDALGHNESIEQAIESGGQPTAAHIRKITE